MSTALRFGLLALIAPAGIAGEPQGVGLVLSGGGARGAAHIGVIEVLEELHVPIDYVVGTSMGSIVGGLYAAGYSPEEMRRIVVEAEWVSILSDAPPRTQLWYRRRTDDRNFLVDLELGWKDGGPVLPPGLILGHNVEAFLEQLFLHVPDALDFDELPIPFRCMATNASDGRAVALEGGSLAMAIRASMSLPGVFAPVDRDGQVLIDGGVVDNVPVDLARAMGASTLIVVDISTPLGELERGGSFLSFSNRVVRILMAENRERALAALGEEDVRLTPELGDIHTMDFARCADAIEIGRAAALEALAPLAALAVDEPRWQAWLARQRKHDQPPPLVRSFRVESDSRLSEKVLRKRSAIRPGAPLDAQALARTRQSVAGLDVFERIEIDATPVEGSPNEVDVLLQATEKDWGPHYLRFGLGARSDLQGSGDYELGLRHTLTPMNALGGEWRNEVVLGTRTHLSTEFYQPLEPGLRWFVAPYLSFEQANLPLIVEREKVAEVNVQAGFVGLDLGRNLGSWGEARIGYGYTKGSASPEIVLPGLLPNRVEYDSETAKASLVVDTLDQPRFPRRGQLGLADFEWNEDAGGDRGSSRSLRTVAGAPLSSGSWTLFPSLEWGTTLDGEIELGGDFYLGGFQRLSGLEQREISGNHYGLAVLQSYWQLSERTTRYGMATYLGASLEAGGVWSTRDAIDAEGVLIAGSAYVAFDTLIGPAYFGLGLTEGGESSVYVFIGPTF